jgi:hypothetical protein
MITVEVPVSSSDVSTPMNAMRAWLDQVRFEPSRFSWEDRTAKQAVVRVQFKVVEEAVIFAERFLGRVL